MRELRKVRGLTFDQLAARCDKSVGYLRQVERDLTRPSVGSLQDISEALAIHVGWFFQPTSVDDTPEAQFVVRGGTRRRRRSDHANVIASNASCTTVATISMALNLVPNARDEITPSCVLRT